MTPFDLRKPSRPGLVGDKPQSGEPGDTILPLVFYWCSSSSSWSKKPSVCFILSFAVPAVANIGSFCTTDNHWADDVTSKALVKDIVVPFFRRKINHLRAVNGPALHGGGG